MSLDKVESVERVVGYCPKRGVANSDLLMELCFALLACGTTTASMFGNTGACHGVFSVRDTTNGCKKGVRTAGSRLRWNVRIAAAHSIMNGRADCAVAIASHRSTRLIRVRYRFQPAKSLNCFRRVMKLRTLDGQRSPLSPYLDCRGFLVCMLCVSLFMAPLRASLFGPKRWLPNLTSPATSGDDPVSGGLTLRTSRSVDAPSRWPRRYWIAGRPRCNQISQRSASRVGTFHLLSALPRFGSSRFSMNAYLVALRSCLPTSCARH